MRAAGNIAITDANGQILHDQTLDREAPQRLEGPHSLIQCDLVEGDFSYLDLSDWSFDRWKPRGSNSANLPALTCPTCAPSTSVSMKRC